MRNFYCIHYSESNTTNQNIRMLLEQACKKRKIKYCLIDARLVNTIKNLPKLYPNDILYRPSTHKKAIKVEKLLINNSASTFYINKSKKGFLDRDDRVGKILMRNQIPIPKTIFDIDNNRAKLKKWVKQVDNFPIIIKKIDGERGVGVIKVDSWECLVSLMDYLITTKDRFVMKEYIKISRPIHSYRAIVLGNKIEIAYKNISLEKNDFRSNANQKKRKREIVQLKIKSKQTIVKAVSILGLKLGAVDFAYNKKGNMKIFEINFPYNFVPIVNDLKYPIHEKMIDYLIEKNDH